MSIVIYSCGGCNPCVEATEWMDQRGIEYTKKGMVDSVTEYPTIVVNGISTIGWSDVAKKMILEEVNKHGR